MMDMRRMKMEALQRIIKSLDDLEYESMGDRMGPDDHSITMVKEEMGSKDLTPDEGVDVETQVRDRNPGLDTKDEMPEPGMTDEDDELDLPGYRMKRR